jgi:membrane protein implicated in regulation of membrane protease activity
MAPFGEDAGVSDPLSWTGAEIFFVVVIVVVAWLIWKFRGGADGEAGRRIERQNKIDFKKDAWQREEAKRILEKYREESSDALEHPREGDDIS